jgi:hypothetical protein
MYSYGLDGRNSIPGGDKTFVFSTVSRPAQRPNQASYPVGTGVLFLGVKQPGREADR